MASPYIPVPQREFRCIHCAGKILIPEDLPPTTGPCPHCGKKITSPAPEEPTPVAAIEAPPLPAPPATPPEEIAPPDIVPPVIAPPEEIAPPEGIAPPEEIAPPIVAPPVEIAPPIIAPPVVAPPKEIAPPAIAAPAIAAPPSQPAAPPLAAKQPPQAVELPPEKSTSPVNPPKRSAAAKSAKPQRSSLIPVMLILLLLFVGAGAAVYFVSKERGQYADSAALSVSTVDPKVRELNYLRIGWQKEAYQVLHGFLAGKSSAEKLPFVLDADRLKQQIDDFYGSSLILDTDTPAAAFSAYELSEEDRKRGMFMMIYDQPPQFDIKEFFRPLASLEGQYGVKEADVLLSTFASVGNPAIEPLRVHAFFKRTPEGLKLDWETFAQTKYRTLQTFAELPEKDQTGVFRVFIVEDVPEKGRAIAGTRTYHLADPANTGDFARVNVKIDSEPGRALSIINWRGTKENQPITRTATVELKWAGESNAPVLEIRLICWEFLGLGGQEKPATATTK